MSRTAESPVIPVKVRLVCECNGPMEPTGIVLTIYPAQFPHKCAWCGVSENHAKTYPYIEYREAR